MPIHILRTLIATFTIATAFSSTPAANTPDVVPTRAAESSRGQSREQSAPPRRRLRPDDGCRELPAPVLVPLEAATPTPVAPQVASCTAPAETVP